MPSGRNNLLNRIQSFRLAVFIAFGLLLGFPLSGAELAIMRNGFSIRYERREVRKELTRLYLTSSGENYVDVQSAEILQFGTEDAPSRVATPLLPQSISLDQAILTTSRRYHLDPDFIVSLIRAESAFNPKAVSPNGAVGLMQLMPSTARQMGVSDPMNPLENIEGGTRYMAELLTRYKNNPILALGAYNAGPARIEQYQGLPPYKATRAYVAVVLADFHRSKARKLGAVLTDANRSNPSSVSRPVASPEASAALSEPHAIRFHP